MDVEEREFFRKINEAAFANPFGSEREIVDLEISGLNQTSTNEAILEKLMSDVGARIARYKGRTVDLDSEERMLLRYGVLFYAFHLFCDDYDELITQQINQGEQPVEVTFAKDLLQLLNEYGFSKKDALKFFSFFSS